MNSDKSKILTTIYTTMGNLFSRKKRSPGSKRKHGDKTDAYSSGANDQRGHVTITPIHTEEVVSLAAVQQGQCLSGSKDKTVVLYDYQNHKVLEKWTGHEREITKVRYGSATNRYFSASRDNTIKTWSRGTQECLREFTGHTFVVTAIDVSQDNTRLCSGSRDNSVKLWDVETGSCLNSKVISRNLVTDIKFIPDSSHIVQCGEDKVVRLFDTRDMSNTHSFQAKQHIQMCCDVTPDGAYCITCSSGFSSNGCEITLWDLRQRQAVCEYKEHTEAVECCVFLPGLIQGRNLIASSSRDCSVRVWDRESKECLSSHFIGGSGPLTSVIADIDGRLCVGSFNVGIQLLQLSREPTLHLSPVAQF